MPAILPKKDEKQKRRRWPDSKKTKQKKIGRRTIRKKVNKLAQVEVVDSKT